MSGKFFIKTYGCQMNDLDGQQIGRLLKGRGMAPTALPEEADLVLINTCSIREKVSQKVYSDVGRFRSLKMQRPQLVLGITGCQAEAEGAHL
jgi:tRNA-2-methylthio-N6-dimethylallyladenosine synthase